MTCRELIDFLDRYLDGELTSAEGAEFAAHLECCPDCVNYLESYTRTIQLSKTWFRDPDEPLPEGVPEELIDAIRAARSQDSTD